MRIGNLAGRLTLLTDDDGMRAINPLSNFRALQAFQFLHIRLQQQMGTGFMSSVKLLA
jgi:hypothetical protein